MKTLQVVYSLGALSPVMLPRCRFFPASRRWALLYTGAQAQIFFLSSLLFFSFLFFLFIPSLLSFSFRFFLLSVSLFSFFLLIVLPFRRSSFFLPCLSCRCSRSLFLLLPFFPLLVLVLCAWRSLLILYGLKIYFQYAGASRPASVLPLVSVLLLSLLQ